MSTFKIGVIGDLHTHWDDIDVLQFCQSDYDLLYFTGDLGGGTPESCLRVARNLSQLNRTTLVMPGNNDLADIDEFAAELHHRSGLQTIAAIRQGQDSPAAASHGGINLCGYSLHSFDHHDTDFTIVAGRPHSMGGPDLSFTDYMVRTYGIGSVTESADRLVALVDETPSDTLLFFSHNGPTGLGGAPEDMWGCDFMPDGGDWGDPDLRTAIDYAKQAGKRVLAVIAGHMHLRTKEGAERPWSREVNGTLYVNAARVPRIFSDDDVYRHHVRLSVTNDDVSVSEELIPQYGA